MGAPGISYVLLLERYEAMEVVCCRDKETDMDCFLGVWYNSDRSAIIQLLRAHYIVPRQQLASGRARSAMDAVKVGSDGKDHGERSGG